MIFTNKRSRRKSSQQSFYPNLHCNSRLSIYVFFGWKFSCAKVENSIYAIRGDASCRSIPDEAFNCGANWRVKLHLSRKFRIWSKLTYMVIFPQCIVPQCGCLKPRLAGGEAEGRAAKEQTCEPAQPASYGPPRSGWLIASVMLLQGRNNMLLVIVQG